MSTGRNVPCPRRVKRGYACFDVRAQKAENGVSTNPRTVCASGTANRAPARRLQAPAQAIAVLEQLCGRLGRGPGHDWLFAPDALATTGARIRIGHARARTANAGWLVPKHAARIVDRPEILEHIHELHDDGLSLQQIADRLEEEGVPRRAEASAGGRRRSPRRFGISARPEVRPSRSPRALATTKSATGNRRVYHARAEISTGAFPPAGQRLERRWKVCARLIFTGRDRQLGAPVVRSTPHEFGRRAGGRGGWDRRGPSGRAPRAASTAFGSVGAGGAGDRPRARTRRRQPEGCVPPPD